MFFRLVVGIREYFEQRVVEWLMGGMILNYGFGLVGESVAWTSPPAWERMAYYMPENSWGWLCILIGALRLIALALNGTFSTTVYARYSPPVRVVTAIGGLGFWIIVLLSISATGSIGTRAYLLPFLLEVWCIFHAGRDMGRAEAGGDGMAR